MMALALRVLRDRDGLDVRHGTAIHGLLIHRLAYDDTPVLDATRRRIREQVIRYARENGYDLDPADITLTEVSPEELDDAWRECSPRDVPLLSGAYVLLGYWTPRVTPPGA